MYRLKKLAKLIKKFAKSILYTKLGAELKFQKSWSKKFKNNKSKVLEYWIKYRCLEEIKQICNLDEHKKVLDVGCGINSVLHFIDVDKYGVDPLADEYKKLYSYPQDMKIIKGSGEKLLFSSNFFDVVFCSNAIDHVDKPTYVISEINRVLNLNGFFVLTVEIFKEKQKRDPNHPHCLLYEDVIKLVNKQFTICFKSISDWISLSRYVDGKTDGIGTKELIIIAKKK